MRDSKYQRIDREEMDKIKNDILTSFTYDSENKTRFHEMMSFSYKTTLSLQDKQRLRRLNLPEVEFNIIEPILSRARDEFKNMSPELKVADEGSTLNEETIKFLESHLRYTFDHNSLLKDGIFKDTTGGGFSVMHCEVGYESERSFELGIKLKKIKDPTLVGFDPQAKKHSKIDGAYCFEHVPLLKEDIEFYWPGFPIESIRDSVSWNEYPWMVRFKNAKKRIYIVTIFHRRVMKKENLLQVIDPATGKPFSILEKNYKELLKDLKKKRTGSYVEPVIVKERKVNVSTIESFKFLGDRYLEKPKDTIYPLLPYLFFDGNSVETDGKQMTRPIIYQAKDLQKTKNMVGISMLNQVVNLRQADILIDERALPNAGQPEFFAAYKDPQSARTAFVYKGIDDDGTPVEKPQYFTPGQINPTLINMFNGLDNTLKYVLGTHDPQVGFKGRDISAPAMIEGATISNALYKPYILSYLHSLSDLGELILALVPKIYGSERDLPVTDAQGFTKMAPVNSEQEGSVKMDFDSDLLRIQLIPGLSFEAEKQRSLRTIVELMQQMPAMNEFMNEKGMLYIFDNLSIRGIQGLKEDLREYMAEKQHMQQEAKKNPPQDPALLAVQAKMQDDAKRDQRERMKMQIDSKFEQEKILISKDEKLAKLELANRQSQRDDFLASLEVEKMLTQAEIAYEKSETESERTRIMYIIKELEVEFNRHKELLGFHKEMTLNNQKGVNVGGEVG